jgi:multisubunit Na+/H+ antiporter MnhC subunit
MLTASVIIFALVGFGIFYFVAKRVLRWAIRLAFIGAVLFALLAGAVAWWWYDPLGSSSNTNQNRNTARPARPAR